MQILLISWVKVLRKLVDDAPNSFEAKTLCHPSVPQPDNTGPRRLADSPISTASGGSQDSGCFCFSSCSVASVSGKTPFDILFEKKVSFTLTCSSRF